MELPIPSLQGVTWAYMHDIVIPLRFFVFWEGKSLFVPSISVSAPTTHIPPELGDLDFLPGDPGSYHRLCSLRHSKPFNKKAQHIFRASYDFQGRQFALHLQCNPWSDAERLFSLLIFPLRLCPIQTTFVAHMQPGGEWHTLLLWSEKRNDNHIQ